MQKVLKLITRTSKPTKSPLKLKNKLREIYFTIQMQWILNPSFTGVCPLTLSDKIDLILWRNLHMLLDSMWKVGTIGVETCPVH